MIQPFPDLVLWAATAFVTFFFWMMTTVAVIILIIIGVIIWTDELRLRNEKRPESCRRLKDRSCS